MPAPCQILEPTEQNLNHCASLLRTGQVIGVPTETVYGLAGNALDEKSVRKIFAVKGRPLIDPLIVHFATPEAARQHIEAPKDFDTLAKQFWPGPMTLVVRKKSSIPDIVTAGLDSVAIRVPQHPTFHSLLERLDFPLAAPSANPFGYVSPTQAKHVQTTLGERITAVLNGGDCQHGLESTIIDLRTPDRPTILRHGPILTVDIQRALLKEVIDGTQSSKVGSAQAAPGMLTQHYSPNTAIHLVENDTELKSLSSNENIALIFQQKPTKEAGPDVYWLSESGALDEIAHNMFALIQRLDQLDYSAIGLSKAPNEGIGQAINDRLTRAASKFH